MRIASRTFLALRWFLWERFRHRPSSAGENNDLELKRPREGPFPRHPPMIAKPNSDNRRGVTHEESTTSRPRSGPHGRPGRAHRGRAHRRERPAPQARAAPLPRMRQGLRLLRHGEPRGPQAVEGDGPGALGLLPGVRALQGALPGARRAHRGRPLGAARGALHARLRGLGGVAGGPLHRLGGLRARPRRVARRGRRVQARLRRAGGRARRLEVRRRAPHRHRRDVVQEGPQVRHGGRRPRPRLPHLGARGHRQGRAQPVPRRARARAEARHRGGDRRRREVDKAAGQAPLPQREVGHGPLPRGPVDERRARRRALRGVERRQGRRQGRQAQARGQARQACQRRAAARGGQGARVWRRPPSRAAATRS